MTYSSLLKLVCHNKTRNIRIIETERKLWNQTTVYEPSTYFFILSVRRQHFNLKQINFFKSESYDPGPPHTSNDIIDIKSQTENQLKKTQKQKLLKATSAVLATFCVAWKMLMLSFSLKKFLPDQSSKIAVKLDKI